MHDVPLRRPGPRRLVASAALSVLAIAAAGLGAGACGSLLPPRDLEPPRVVFNDLTVDSLSLQRVRFTLKVGTSNPNPIDLPLSNIRFDLSLFGQRVAQGTVPEQRIALPAQGEREVPVAFDVATADLRAMLMRIATGVSSDATWEVRGTLNWGNSPLPLPFAKRGDINSLARLREFLGR